MSRPDPPRALERVELVFDALAHASRRRVLLMLPRRGGELTAGAIAEDFECSWPTMSRHLKLLVDAGLLEVEQRGRERAYRLAREGIQVAEQWLDRLNVSP